MRISRLRGGRFGRGRVVARRALDYAGAPSRLAVGPRGDAVLTWERNDHSIEADPLDREEDCCYRLRIAVVDRRGRVVARRGVPQPRGYDQLAEAVALGPGRSCGRRLRPPVLRAAAGRDRPRPPGAGDEGAGAGGGAVVPGAAAAAPGRGQHRLRAVPARRVRRLRRGRWKARRTAVSSYSVPEVVTAPSGAQAAVYERGRHLYAATRRSGGRFRVARLARDAAGAVAIAPSGRAVVAWSRHSPSRLRVASARPGRHFGRARAVRAGGLVVDLGVAAGPRGRIALAWKAIRRGRKRLYGVVGRGRPRLLNRRRPHCLSPRPWDRRRSPARRRGSPTPTATGSRARRVPGPTRRRAR